MSKYDDELVPTTAQQIDRSYPEWSTSTPRLKIHAAKALSIVDHLPQAELKELLARLTKEGLEPCFDEALSAQYERRQSAR